MKVVKIFTFLGLTFSLGAVSELDYYRENLTPAPIPPLADTLFEKTVWRRKVSHLVLEEYAGRYFVTLLMMERWPYNYKGKNYPVKYLYLELDQALAKFKWLDSFLERNGVLRLKVHGDIVVAEKILYPGEPFPVRQARAVGAGQGQ